MIEGNRTWQLTEGEEESCVGPGRVMIEKPKNKKKRRSSLEGGSTRDKKRSRRRLGSESDFGWGAP